MAKRQLEDLAVSALCESMGMMLQSGISVEEAIGLFSVSEKDGELARTLSEMKQKVESGTSFSEAMKESGVFDNYAVQMTAAAERTGKLEQAMFSLSAYYRNQSAIRSDLKATLIYPCGMILMVFAVLFVMLKMVLPVFQDVYESLSGPIAAGSFSYLRFSKTLCVILLILMLALLLAVVIGLVLWKTGRKESVKKILSFFPIVKNITETIALSRFSNAFEMYLSSGFLQDEALSEAGKMTDDQSVEKKLEECKKQMEQGYGFGSSAYETRLYEPVYGRMLLPAEKSGNLENAMRRLNELLRKDSADQITRLINVLEPLLSGILMVCVAVILVSLMLPLIGIMNSFS